MAKRAKPAEVKSEILDLIETEGIKAATRAAIAICNDDKAAAPARATMAGFLFRAASLGGFGKNADRESDIPLHEMSPEQLDMRVQKAFERIDKYVRGEPLDLDDGGSPFD
ncbi:hypothetical protein GCM10011390_44010 [Aureimonas endophytica]|uniref:Uncharacterized protein n=1 Tax=Aureimonas endophytica TaxID=2027858 RepID=A0A916ZZC7_9HYPH|nr:hypothetical protein [Aureimonas endophytica]GGE19953.1 hypothetical protein GCM10011390_44010 [Aureimonas endophytica]